MDLQKVHILGCNFLYRKGSSDEKAIIEVIKNHVYKRSFTKSKRNFDILPRETWLDLGANIGTFTVWASLRGAKVIAYEPEPDNFYILQENIKLNNLNAQVYEKAVIGGQEEKMELSLGKDNNFWRHSLVKKKSDKSIMVNCININQVLTDDIDGIKMDVEGAEFEIFKTVETWKNVKKFVFEYDFDIDSSMQHFWATIKKLEGHFKHIEYGNFAEGLTEYKFFPPGRIIYCFER